MLDPEQFRQNAHQVVDWMADYLKNVEQYPVKSQAKPSEVFNQLPDHPPTAPESFDQIFKDFNEIILPGITHWQNPNFFAYFPANTSPPSILAEMLTSTLAAQCMIWETSPAAAELEEKTLDWLRQLLGFPSDFQGVIQDSASTATLTAILTAREKITAFKSNQQGLKDCPRLRIYCSTQTHSSIEKAVKIAGLGQENLVKIPVDQNLAMDVDALEKAITQDLAQGFSPTCVIAALGTTSTCAFDPLEKIAKITQAYNIWLHVDAAYAGSAFILPEYQHLTQGIAQVDSFVFNPHKWLFTNFDCSAYFIKDPQALVQTFEILPEYLKTKTLGQVKDYRDWGVPLGRRFRALKLWFVLRSFGKDQLQKMLRHHIKLAENLTTQIQDHPDFELITKTSMNVICFRYHPTNLHDEEQLNALNEKILHTLNAQGKIYLTHTKVRKQYTMRLVIGQTNVQASHVENAWALIKQTAQQIAQESNV